MDQPTPSQAASALIAAGVNPADLENPEAILAAFRRDITAVGVNPVSLAVFERLIRRDERERIARSGLASA